MRLSVIVPIYNKSQYLSSLFNSLLHQGLEPYEFEIILVNDGSTDHSEKICVDFIKSFPELNVRYLYQNNSGVSVARNVGIDNATGDYIHFIDSDDTLIDGSYRYMLDKFASLKSDYIGFGFNLMDVRNQEKKLLKIEAIGGDVVRKVSGLELMCEALWPSSSILGFYKRQFFLSHEVKFPTGISIGEDVWFNFDFFSNNPSCTLTSCRPYIYWFGCGSVMTTITKDKAEKWFHSYHSLLSYMIDKQIIFPPHTQRACIQSYDGEIKQVRYGIAKVVKHHIEVFLPKALQLGIPRNRFEYWSKKFIDDGILPQRADNLYLKLSNFIFLHPSCYPVLSWTYRYIFLRIFYRFFHK